MKTLKQMKAELLAAPAVRANPVRNLLISLGTRNGT